MTKKSTERIYLNRFLEAMGWPYELEDQGEAPDFIISVAGRRIGVEVVQVFADQDAEYSEKREDESNRLRWLRKLSWEYYEAGGPPISLQLQIHPGLFERLRGRIPPDLRERILNRLLARASRLKECATLESRVRGRYRSLVATLWVRKLPQSFARYSGWRLLNDAMAWVPSLSQAHLDAIVSKKAKKLAAYQQRVPHVVLLMVADGYLASGFVRYEGAPVAGRGFEAVYLLHHPKGKVQELAAPAGS